LVRVDQRDEAARALNALEETAAGLANPHLASAMLQFGRAYRDRAALVKANRLYADLVQFHPGERRFRDGASAAKRALADLDRSPSSEPAGSRPGG